MNAGRKLSLYSAANVVTLVLWLAALAVMAVGLWSLRESVLRSFATPESQQEWDEWRDAVASGNANMGSVQRKTPKSDEPPTLVLLRDHFAACLVGLWLITSVLYATLALLVRGVLSQPARRDDLSTKQA
jgi:hypothetical protein